jgi:hypothetical protein
MRPDKGIQIERGEKKYRKNESQGQPSKRWLKRSFDGLRNKYDFHEINMCR